MTEAARHDAVEVQDIPMAVVCEACQGTSLVFLSHAQWCEEHQVFVVADAFLEKAYCQVCESPVRAHFARLQELNRRNKPCQC